MYHCMRLHTPYETNMSDLVSVAAIKDLLTECPICTEHFDESTRIPRRMPCCVQSICQPCLETYTGGAATLSCPMCRHRHNLPGGVKSLPKETLILKTLDYLKIQKGLHLPCTDCPDKETAVAQCDNCGTFLCSLCLSAHKRNTVSKAHTINTFDEMKGRPVQSFRRLHQCSQHQHPLQFYCYTCDNVVCVSCTVVDHKEGKGHNVVSVNEAHQGKAKSTNDVLGKLEEKTKRLSETESALQKKIENIKLSMRVARDDINKIFDNLTDRLNQRRTILLSDVDGKSAENLKLTEEALDSTRQLLTKVKSSSEYMRQMRSKADKVEDLQVMGSSEASLNSMLKESPQETPFDRTGVSFVQANVQHLQNTINVAGMVRSVTFSPTERPNGMPDTEVYNAIILEPAEFPTVMAMDRSICDQKITCPTLEWDSSTAHNNIDVSGCVITNTTSAVPSPDTGCRIQDINSCLASRPLMVKNCQGQRCMYRVKFRVCLNELIEDNTLIQEIALTPTPVDTGGNQVTGLSVYFATCPYHKQQLCLRVLYNSTFLTDRPLIQNRVGQSIDLQLCFLMDGANDKILVIDAGDNTVYTTVTDVDFDRPMWVMMYVGNDVSGELITGHNITGTFANYNH
ncbi:E3 ubiquitin-protein ligase TRIM33-like [Haliotis rufescens]|uniref:E3 ubiquitin-protein ligase TRIM33-like n=1 Tax=Haliotis rufescens TaxID=6454 RepID=UPI00201FA888|nr:E3 ubiquitin-protein ligase TRIM33-like [Haliotis rufescens]